MKSNYKRLESYLEFVDSRVIDHDSLLDLDSIRGISSISKNFIKTRANLVGVVADKYKVVETNHFAYNPNTARMGDKIPIALNQFNYPVLVSSIYPTFKIKNINELHPEYLMMWFRRPEFDRYARFMSHGSAREVFDVEEMNGITLPIPSITKQREIVKEYNVIQKRIALNQQMIDKLEETAKVIYKQWFLDFEFPDENGKPYKSSGGQMVFNEEMEKEIPKSWEVVSIKEFCREMKSGGTPSRDNINYWNSNDIPWLKTGEVSNRVLVESEEYISFQGCKNSSAKKLPKNTVLIAMYGEGKTKGQAGYLRFEATTNQACCAMICGNEFESTFLYYFLRINQAEIANMANGGAQPNLSKELIENIRLVRPHSSDISKHSFVRFINHSEILERENQKLLKMNNLLLSKLATLEN